MTPADLEYVKSLLLNNQIQSPVLELGSGYGGDTCKEAIMASGLSYVGTDLSPGPDVDILANFEDSGSVTAFAHLPVFGTALVLNVLEHTFDPIAVLDNVVKLIRPGGNIVVLTPAVWPLHSYPFDAYRLLPNFYETYAQRRNVELDLDTFYYVGIGKVQDHRWPSGEYQFPNPYRGKAHYLISRIIHRIFNTPGRGLMFKNHLAVACVFRKSHEK